MKLAQKIAIIEDDLDVQELVKAFFTQRGYQVKPYDDALALLREVQKLGHVPYDVVITDLNLPNLSGIDFTKKMRAQGFDTPIILITVQKGVEIAVKAIEAGAYDFVVKPIHFPQLLVSVERALYLRQIQSENQVLKTAVAVKDGTNMDGIIGRSQGLLRAVDLAKRVAKSTASVFVSGETGVGKEVIAKAIHHYSDRSKAPFVAINCSAIPENLLESELFGHAKGAFTGANDKKIGMFEEAEGGTLFLDEIGDLSLPLQAKLLRVLQEKCIKRIGENQTRKIDVRVISATHKDLTAEITAKNFREDLFFRLNVIPIKIPPLRERKEDILPLAEFFLKKYSALNGKDVKGFSKEVIEYLLKRQWRGNVRELENTIERALVLCSGPQIEMRDAILDDDSSPAATGQGMSDGRLASMLDSMEAPIESLESFSYKYILYALKRNRGAKDKTAKELGIDRKTLYRRITELEKSGALSESLSESMSQPQQ